MNIPALKSLQSGGKETVFTLIGDTYHIRNFTVVKPANAPQSGSGLNNGEISDEA